MLDAFEGGKEEITFNLSVVIAIASMNGILANAFCKALANGPFFCLGGIRGPDQLAEIFHGVVLLQNSRHDGAAAHEFNQFPVKRPFLVHGIEFPGLFSTQFGEFQGDNVESRLDDLVENSSRMAIADGIRLDHGKCSVGHMLCGGLLCIVCTDLRGKSRKKITFFGILRLKLDIRCHFYIVKPITEIYGLLDQPRKVVITMHQKPDADALGSALGLYHCLVQLGHQVTVVSPTNWPRFLNWMPDSAKVLDFEGMADKALKVIGEAEWVFCLDFNILSRTKRMAPLLESLTSTKILIDHHEQPQTGQFAYGISDPGKSSTSEMVYDFIVHSGHGDKINEKIAECLYAGVMADTGSFRFPITSAAVHRMVADLKDRGLKHSIVHENIYDNFLENKLRFTGHVLLNRMEIFYEYNAALISIPKSDLLKFDITTGDTEGLVNYPLSIQGIRMAGLVIDRDEERKWSFRSKGNVDVNTFARQYFNGGGHFNASGGRSTETLAQNVAAFKKALQENLQTLQPEYPISVNND